MNHNEIPAAPQYIKDFEQLGFGMFVHFGLYSQLNRGEWTYSVHHMNMEEYEPLIHTFDVGSMAEIVRTAKSAGCKYIVLTTRHHEGFSLYDTHGLNDFDVMHSPTGRDLVAEFVELCREERIVPFLYHTTLDWHHKDFNENFDEYLEYLNKSVELLCTNYGKIGGFWFDGNWSKEDADWKEEKLYRMIRSHQPEAMIINNTGLEGRGKMGVEEIDAVTFERGMPEPLDLRGRSKYVAGEMCQTLFNDWGIADDIDFKPVKQLVEELCECRKVGANFLLNIGPKPDGSVPTMQRGIMECMGRWMSAYGRAIYNGRPCITYPDKREFVLRDVHDPKTLYLFRFNPGHSDGNKNVSLSFCEDTTVVLDKFCGQVESIAWMDNAEQLLFAQEGDVLTVNMTGYPYGQSLCVRVAEVKIK